MKTKELLDVIDQIEYMSVRLHEMTRNKSPDDEIEGNDRREECLLVFAEFILRQAPPQDGS